MRKILLITLIIIVASLVFGCSFTKVEYRDSGKGVAILPYESIDDMETIIIKWKDDNPNKKPLAICAVEDENKDAGEDSIKAKHYLIIIYEKQ